MFKIKLSLDKWLKFENWLKKSPVVKKQLVELFSKKSVLEK